MTTPSLSTDFEFSSVPFFGRSFDEYVHFFSLDPAALRGRAVLDVAAGPSSFTAGACRMSIEALAVDPLYGYPPEVLAVHVQLDYERMRDRIRAHAARFRLRTFASIEAADHDRTGAARGFLADYAAHFVHGRYLGAALPHLPFADAAFDLVLCAHLLFTHAKLLGPDFHLAACRELVRVTRDEVRIHPVCGPDSRPHPELDRLRCKLEALGIASEIRPVDYEFFPGSGSMLVLKHLQSS